MEQVTQSNTAHQQGQSASYQSNGITSHSAAGDSQTGGADKASSPTQADSAEATTIQNNLKARKRTKTGCLTCRKRRIKCGEERPTCANCIKSKRSCEGYAPRLTFKDPLGAFRPGWAMKGHGAHYQNYSNSNGAIGQYTRQQALPGAQNQLPVIAPRPLPSEPPSDIYHPSDVAPSPWSAGPQHSPQQGLPSQHGLPPQHGPPSHLQPSNDLPPRMRQMYQKQANPSENTLQHIETEEMTGDFATNNVPPMLQPQNIIQENIHSLEGRPLIPQWVSSAAANGSTQEEHVQSSGSAANQYVSSLPNNRPQDYYQNIRAEDTNYGFDGLVNAKPPVTHIQPAQSFQSQPVYQYSTPMIQGASNPPNYTWSADTTSVPYSEDDFRHRLQAQQLGNSYTEVFQKQMGFEKLRHQLMDVTDDSEDDLYDVESDEDGVAIINRSTSTPQNDVGLMLALAASQDDRVLRSYTTFLNEPNVLSSYQPAYAASPLMDSTTARVFCHFITATGPSMSIYERHPVNPSVMFTGAPVPSSQQSLWTYTLPMKALSNQALLHAMLAIASLHISALQKTPPTASLRHYHFALRRLTKTLSIPSKRTDIGTIAATLILGHYESTTAEHSKWNQHLAGARQLLMEIDFKGLTRQIKENKVRKRGQTQSGTYYSGGNMIEYHNNQQTFETPEEEVDEVIVSQLMGWKIKYDEYGDIVNDYTETPRPAITEKDTEIYKIHSDLFWWYAKQDVYQSAVSGNPLLLPYDRWGHCPPRAPIGKLYAIYGTMDHLILLMGRIADFASKDQLRKRKVMKKNRGQWRPPPGMFPSAPSSGGPPPGFSNRPQGGTPGLPTSQPPQPPMFGMIPIGPNPRTPDRFMQAPRDQIYVQPTIDEDNFELDEAVLEAEIEWRSIQNALDLFERSLGPDYDSLPDYLAPSFETPFGVALQYRTWSIACIWVLFYTGRIIATRMHPSMPPAALMAAGVAAPQTVHWASTIGRIFCGLQMPPSDQPLNPAVGAALMESTIGMFFAGVQYTDPVQRTATINRLLTIAEMTGLQSSALIAAGCELCWVKMGEAGRGPPYTPRMDRKAKDDRVANRPVPKADVRDRQLVYVNPGTRTQYGMGVLGLESDFSTLSTNT